MQIDFSEIDLDAIRKWDESDFAGLMEYIEQFWRYADCGYWELKDNHYFISTAGWSDNEEIIGAMMDNQIWWFMYWRASIRGGHYEFAPIGESTKTLFKGV